MRANKIEGISGLRDESDREGVRVVIEIRRDSQADIVLNQLWRNTPLQVSFGINMLALVGGRPLMLTLRNYVAEFLKFREEVISRARALNWRRREIGRIFWRGYRLRWRT